MPSLTNSGNKDAQDSLVEHIKLIDRDGRVWKHLKERLTLSKDWLVERNATVMSAAPFVRMDDAMKAEYGE